MIKVSLENKTLTVSGIKVQIVRKDIKNLHLAVYPPNGKVRVAVPKNITDDNVRLAVVSKLSWIKKQQKDFKQQLRQTERKYVSGECHYFFGKRYRLELVERTGKHEIVLFKSGKLKMFVKSKTSLESKEKLLNEWYRDELKKKIPDLIKKWQPVIGRKATSWSIRKMKTKWGGCNIEKKHIVLNLELAKKPAICLEYILVHELVHLLERKHNARFKIFMDTFMPNWSLHRNVLNKSPLANENWLY